MNQPPKRPGFGSAQLPAIEARLKPATRTYTMGPLDEHVLYSFRLRRGLYLRILQMMHHMPGAFHLQSFLAEAIEAAMAQHPEADMPIPAEALAELLSKNKKLQAGPK